MIENKWMFWGKNKYIIVTEDNSDTITKNRSTFGGTDNS